MSPAAGKGSGAGGFLRVEQVRSGIGTKPKHRGTLRALGLKGIGSARVLPDRPEVRGMLSRVPHLVELSPATPEQAAAEDVRRQASRAAHAASRGAASRGARGKVDR